MEERLIEKVSENEALYNTDSPGYRDQRARNSAWREVGRDMNLPASKCREIWSKLRNCYTNALKRRIIAQNGQPLKKYPKWKYADQMSFLVPYMVMRANQDANSSDISDAAYETQHDNYLDDSSQHQDADYRSQGAFELYPCSPSVGSGQKRKKPTEISAEEMFQILETNASMQKEKDLKKLDIPNLDSTEMFYLSMAKTVKKLPIIEQARIRMELCRLISEAEIRNLSTGNSSLNLGAQNVNSESAGPHTMAADHSIDPEDRFNVNLKMK